jgi:tetratricopeptide (TPR) repeat protein
MSPSVFSRFGRVSRLAALLLVTATLVACDSGDAGGKIEEARVVYAQGRLDEAEQLYEEALESEPDNAFALVGLANIHLDRTNLEAAARRFDRLDELELDRRSEQLVERARLRYNRLVYDRARGQGPASPADPGAYEESLIGLFNAEGNPRHASELVELFVLQARRSLGVTDPTEPVLPTSAYVQDAPLDVLRNAQAAYQRLTQRDPRLRRVLNPPDAIRQEAEAMGLALQLKIFEREVDERFNALLRGPLTQEGRFDAARNQFRIAFTSPEPFLGERPAEGEALDEFRQQLALTLVIEELTDHAYRIRGRERGTHRPLQLGHTREEVEQAYAAIDVVSFDFSREGIVTMEVLAPYSLLPRTVYRLDQYVAWLATQPAQGPGTGTGMGTGVPEFEEGTGMGLPLDDFGELPGGEGVVEAETSE